MACPRAADLWLCFLPRGHINSIRALKVLELQHPLPRKLSIMSGLEIPGLIAAAGEIAALGIKTAQKLHEIKTSIQDNGGVKRLRLQIESTTHLLGEVKEELQRQGHRSYKPQLAQHLHVSLQSCRLALEEVEKRADMKGSDSREHSFFKKIKFALFSEHSIRQALTELNNCTIPLLCFLVLLGNSASESRYAHVSQLFNNFRGSKEEFFSLLDHLDFSEPSVDTSSKDYLSRQLLSYADLFRCCYDDQPNT